MAICVQEQNRLQVADECVKLSIEQLIDTLQEQIDQCRRQMQQVIDSTQDLRQKQQRLETIPGVGRSTAQILLSVLIDLDKFQTAKHLISYLGLSPVIRDSGKFSGLQRVSKMGNRSCVPAFTCRPEQPVRAQNYGTVGLITKWGEESTRSRCM